MGHVCTTEVRRFRSPLLRALLLKGHAYKAECGEETLLKELSLGLDGYIYYKVRGNKDLTSANFERWKMAILRRVQEELRKGDHPLYPQGDTGKAEVQRLQQHLVFLKEDRAPHVIVGMRKYRYMLERERYLTRSSTFMLSAEDEKAIFTGTGSTMKTRVWHATIACPTSMASGSRQSATSGGSAVLGKGKRMRMQKAE